MVSARTSAANSEAAFPVQAAKRALKNKSLSFLSALKDDAVTQQLLQRFREASCMTDQTAALACLSDTPGTPVHCTKKHSVRMQLPAHLGRPHVASCMAFCAAAQAAS